MPELVGLYLTLWALAGAGVVVHEVEGPVHFVDLYGEERHAPGALSCQPGRPPELWISNDADLEVLAHELAHAYDCLDDGELNGSPAPRPAQRPTWVSDYCWSSDAEWYACDVVHVASGQAGRRPALAAGAAPPAFAPAPEPRAHIATGRACAPAWRPTPDLLALGAGLTSALVTPEEGCEGAG
jgi:hypothetical protein